MYSPEAIPRDMASNTTFLFEPTINFKNSMEGQFMKSKEFMGSDPLPQQQQQNYGLLRYRSAPSSFFVGLVDGNVDNFLGNRSPSSEPDTIFSALNEIPSEQRNQNLQIPEPMKQEMMECGKLQGNGELNQYEATVSCGGGTVVGSYSVGLENQVQLQMRNGPNLQRQSSSPAGFFSGFDVAREARNFAAANGTKVDGSSSNGGLKNHMKFSSGPSSSSRIMPSIAENESWNDFSFNSLKRNRDGDSKMFSSFNDLDDQNGELRNYTPVLSHHLSLPKTSSEMLAIDKFMQFQQDSVPCKIRAKRGCATHPRSIAERMRRTRISERMKKLQELFPNMDKQTNTADMLDLAVEYIKDLQKHVQTLTDKKAKCTCSSKLQ